MNFPQIIKCKLNIFIIFSFSYCNLFAMQQETRRVTFVPEWQESTKAFKDTWEKRQPNFNLNAIKAVSRKGDQGYKAVCIMVTDLKNAEHFTPLDPEYKQLQQFTEFVGKEMYAARFQEKGTVETPLTGAKIQYEFITAIIHDSTQLAQLIKGLHTISNNAASISTISFGAQAPLVNKATRIRGAAPIDTIIHLQSPIYEWYKTLGISGFRFAQDENETPINFRRLYNFYSKAPLPVFVSPQYIERKYHQQAKVLANEILMPVKNIRVTSLRSLLQGPEELTNEDFQSSFFFSQLPLLISKIERYTINFDLFAIVHNPAQTISKTIQGNFPFVIINRPLEFKDSTLWAVAGTYGNAYPIISKVDLNSTIFSEIKRRFTHEIIISDAQLRSLSTQFQTIPTDLAEIESRIAKARLDNLFGSEEAKRLVISSQ